MKPLFTPEELAELAAFDAEIDDEPLTMDENREARERDKAAKYDLKDKRAQKIAENKRAYYEANREKIAENKRAYYEANREKIAENQRAYYEANREKWNAYQREYKRRKRAEEKAEKGRREHEDNHDRDDAGRAPGDE